MKVMLTKDVENVGRAGDVKEVADGYGRNFLLRRKLAVPAGKGAEAEAKRLKDAAVKRETKDRVEAQTLADEIDNKTVVVRLKVGAEDKAFGSITNQDIAAALKAQHRVEIDAHLGAEPRAADIRVGCRRLRIYPHPPPAARRDHARPVRRAARRRHRAAADLC